MSLKGDFISWYSSYDSLHGVASSWLLNNFFFFFHFLRPMPAAFCKEILSLCSINTQHLPESHQHLSEALSKVGELSGPTDGLTDKLVNILLKTLVKLLPCVILNKREVHVYLNCI